MPIRYVRRFLSSALVVDDNERSSWITATALSAMGYQSVWRARSIAQAMRYCEVLAFDMAIIDLVLGNERGVDLVVRLWSWPGAVDRIILLSADAGGLRRAAADHVPADAFLEKPLDLVALSQCIVGHLQKPPYTDGTSPIYFT